jgi:hypothetical protein
MTPPHQKNGILTILMLTLGALHRRPPCGPLDTMAVDDPRRMVALQDMVYEEAFS